MANKDKNEQEPGQHAPQAHYRVLHAHVSADGKIFEMGATLAHDDVSAEALELFLAADAVVEIKN